MHWSYRCKKERVGREQEEKRKGRGKSGERIWSERDEDIAIKDPFRNHTC